MGRELRHLAPNCAPLHEPLPWASLTWASKPSALTSSLCTLLLPLQPRWLVAVPRWDMPWPRAPLKLPPWAPLAPQPCPPPPLPPLCPRPPPAQLSLCCLPVAAVLAAVLAAVPAVAAQGPALVEAPAAVVAAELAAAERVVPKLVNQPRMRALHFQVGRGLDLP